MLHDNGAGGEDTVGTERPFDHRPLTLGEQVRRRTVVDDRHRGVPVAQSEAQVKCPSVPPPRARHDLTSQPPASSRARLVRSRSRYMNKTVNASRLSMSASSIGGAIFRLPGAIEAGWCRVRNQTTE